MRLEAHFINVGDGNMTLLKLPDGCHILYDCNITPSAERGIFNYLYKTLGLGCPIDCFVASSGHPDHIRGIERLHESHPISLIWDNGILARSPQPSPELTAFARIRGSVLSRAVKPGEQWRLGRTTISCLNSAAGATESEDDRSIVLHFQYDNASLLLAGRTTCRPWIERIVPLYRDSLRATVLLAPAGGSWNFFATDPSAQPYTSHLSLIRPRLTVISSGNAIADPSLQASLRYYYAGGESGHSSTLLATCVHGAIRIELQSNGAARVYRNA